MAWLDYTSDYFSTMKLTSDSAEVINTLIDSACEFVEKFCNRRFLQAEFDRVFTVSQEGSIVLDNPPIDRICRLCVATGGWILLRNSLASVTNATYSTNDSGLVLDTIADGERTQTAISWADAKTLGDLADAVGKVGHGWTATVSPGFSGYPSFDVVSKQFGNAKGGGNTLNCWTDYSGYYDVTMRLPLYEGTYYDLSPESGILRAYFIPGTKVRAVWVGGWADPPEPIKQVVANLVISAYTGPQGRVKQMTLGQFSYTLADVSTLAVNDKKVLAYYKDKRI